MIKLNETSSANVNVLGEDELTQVVGGCHRRRGGYGYGGHCGGGWRRKRDYGHCGGGYDNYGGDYESSESYGDDYESDDEFSGSNNVQVADVDVTINIAQVQG